MTDRPSGLRGMLPYQPDSITLCFGDYINRKKLPVLPKGGFGHVGNNPPPGGWRWYANDKVGDCVCAGAQHETMVWAMATGRTVPNFDSSTLTNYSNMLVAQGGDPYEPNDPATDTGLDPAAAAKFRQQVGLTDDAGVVHKIDAYAVIRNVDELEIATYCFGVAGLGLLLPDSADIQFQQHHLWDDLRGVPSGGHYPPCVGVNSKGNLVLSTWNDLQAATKQYVDQYWSVGIAYLSQEYMLANGKSPELIDWASLEDDLAVLGA